MKTETKTFDSDEEMEGWIARLQHLNMIRSHKVRWDPERNVRVVTAVMNDPKVASYRAPEEPKKPKTKGA